MGFDLMLYVNSYKVCFVIGLFCVCSSGESGELYPLPGAAGLLFSPGLTKLEKGY